MKSIIRLVVLVVLIGGGFFCYKLLKKGELNQEGIQQNFQLYKEKGIKGTLSEISDGLVELSGEAKKQFDAIDWTDVRSKLKLSDDDLKSYQDSVEWLYQDDKTAIQEDEVSNEEIQSTLVKESDEKDHKVREESNKVVESKTVVKSKPVTKPKQVAKYKPKEVQGEKGSRYYHEGLELLNEAKSLAKKGMPGQPNHQSYLKKSAKKYKKVLSKFEKAKKDRKLTKDQSKRIEELEPKIAGQIYWAKKLGAL